MQNAMKNTTNKGNTNVSSGTTMKTTKSFDNNYDIQLPKKDTTRIKEITSDKMKLKEDIGWRIGINTGFSMNEGRLKNLIDKTFGPDPEATQKNKNVKIYKPN
jgi:hypothetical protein